MTCDVTFNRFGSLRVSLVRFVARPDASGMSQRKAAKDLEREQERELGAVVYPADALRMRYRDNKPHKVEENLPPAPAETCAVDDLFALVEADKKFSTIYADPPWMYQNQGTRSATRVEGADFRADCPPRWGC